MSKLMNDLTSISRTKKNDNIVMDQTPEGQKQAPTAKEPKGIYAIGFLTVILVVFSALSMSASLKTQSRLEKVEKIAASADSEILSRLEKAEAAYTAVLHASGKQGNRIEALESLIAGKNLEEIDKIAGMREQVNDLETAVEETGKSLEEMTAAHSALKITTKKLADDLKTADQLMLDRYILLGDKVKRLTDADAAYLNTY